MIDLQSQQIKIHLYKTAYNRTDWHGYGTRVTEWLEGKQISPNITDRRPGCIDFFFY